MCLVDHAFGGEFCSLTTFWSNQLHLRKLNGELGSETSDLSLNHPNFPCPFCTKIFDEKAEVVEHLDTLDGREDLFAMIRLSVMRKLITISTTATSSMIPPCSFCPKKRLKGMNLWKYRGGNPQEFQMCLFCQETFMSILNFVKHIFNHHKCRYRHFLCSDIHLC